LGPESTTICRFLDISVYWLTIYLILTITLKVIIIYDTFFIALGMMVLQYIMTLCIWAVYLYVWYRLWLVWHKYGLGARTTRLLINYCDTPEALVESWVKMKIKTDWDVLGHGVDAWEEEEVLRIRSYRVAGNGRMGVCGGVLGWLSEVW
jgi:hypothetical protein